MAGVTLITMSRNFLAKIWYSSLVMRQVSGRRLEVISVRPKANTFRVRQPCVLKNDRAFQDTAALLG